MPKGTEPTLGLIVQAVENDAKMASIMELDTATVYLEEVPSPFSYPFIVIVESKESSIERNSETIGGDPDTAFFNEFRRVSVAACSNSSDMAWKMVERFRNKFTAAIPSTTVKLGVVQNPLFNNATGLFSNDGVVIEDVVQQGGLAIQGSGNDIPSDAFDISCIPETIQKSPQNTRVKDDLGKEIWSSAQDFTFATMKLGSN